MVKDKIKSDKKMIDGFLIANEIKLEAIDYTKEGKNSFCLVSLQATEENPFNIGMGIVLELFKRRKWLIDSASLPIKKVRTFLDKNQVLMFSYGNKKPMRDFDIIGLNCYYPFHFFNVVPFLKLSGINPIASERTDKDPLIILGGHMAFEPEPVSQFIDIIFVGEAEDSLNEFLDVYKGNLSRKKLLQEASKIKGVYVPSLYKTTFDSGGWMLSHNKLDGQEEILIKYGTKAVGK